MPRLINLDNMVLPAGRKAGVRREHTSERRARDIIAGRCASVRGQIDDIPEEYWEDEARRKFHALRRERYRYTLDQDGITSCAAESGCGGKAATDARQGLPLVVYNPLFNFYKTSGGRNSGSTIGSNVSELRDTGCCPEEVWPRSKGFRAKPSREAYRVAKIFRLAEFFYVETPAELVSALLQGFDVHAGYSGHAIVFCQYLGRGKLLLKNSWGADWSDNGFGELSLRNVYFPYGVYAYKNVIPWEEDDWKPQHDQVALAAAVQSYTAGLMKRRRVWERRYDRWRADEYQRVLGSCGLAV